MIGAVGVRGCGVLVDQTTRTRTTTGRTFDQDTTRVGVLMSDEPGVVETQTRTRLLTRTSLGRRSLP